jgi:tetratricopeptide (TPR) repeat protein
LLRQGKFAESIEHFQKAAIQTDSDLAAQTLAQLGTAELRVKKIPEALQHLERALALLTDRFKLSANKEQFGVAAEQSRSELHAAVGDYLSARWRRPVGPRQRIPTCWRALAARLALVRGQPGGCEDYDRGVRQPRCRPNDRPSRGLSSFSYCGFIGHHAACVGWPGKPPSRMGSIYSRGRRGRAALMRLPPAQGASGLKRTLLILAEQMTNYRSAGLVGELGHERGLSSSVCLFALIGYGLRQLTKAMRRSERPDLVTEFRLAPLHLLALDPSPSEGHFLVGRADFYHAVQNPP